MTNAIGFDRARSIRHAWRLEWFTVAWNSLEGLVAIVSGLMAGSIALVGFGLDSIIEVASGGALLWRLDQDRHGAKREHAEGFTLRIVGWCFLALATYIAGDSLASLIKHEAPERSVPGMMLAAASILVMPVLAGAKRRVARSIGSAALNADARQTDFCTYLSAILLGGLLLNAVFGLWWADPVAGLVMAPIIGKEGVQTLRGVNCCGGSACR